MLIIFRYWFERGFPQEAKEFWRLTERLYEQIGVSSTDSKDYWLRRANLDSATASMEANNAQDCLNRFKTWIDNTDEPDSETASYQSQYEYGLYLNELGVAYGMSGLYDTAVEHFLNSIEAFQGMTGYDDTLLSWPEPNLGLIYWVQGRYDEAKQVLQEILQIHEDAWGPDDEKTFKLVPLSPTLWIELTARRTG